MPKVVIVNLQNKSIIVDDKRTRLLDSLLKHSDWMHACGGKGRCTTCKVKVVSEIEGLSELSIHEKRFRELGRLQENERLSCQIFIQKDIKIEVPKDAQLPHVPYDY
jgi:2Fe-2S ferredoxin